VTAVQRALSDFGYGQIKPTGVYDPDTRAAIEKFERDHKLPVTGQLSDRVVRELAAMTGRPLE
jgi:peptidoglycan hydrolase-like protein with peptidoglycan-binding domain